MSKHVCWKPKADHNLIGDSQLAEALENLFGYDKVIEIKYADDEDEIKSKLAGIAAALPYSRSSIDRLLQAARDHGVIEVWTGN